MRKRIQGMLEAMFGPSRNDLYSALLKSLSDVAMD